MVSTGVLRDPFTSGRYTVYKDHITLEDYEIHDGMNLELYCERFEPLNGVNTLRYVKRTCLSPNQRARTPPRLILRVLQQGTIKQHQINGILTHLLVLLSLRRLIEAKRHTRPASRTHIRA